MLALYNSLPSHLGTVHEVGIEKADSVECEDPDHKQDRERILPKRSVVWLDMQGEPVADCLACLANTDCSVQLKFSTSLPLCGWYAVVLILRSI